MNRDLPAIGALILLGAFCGTCVALGMLAGTVTMVGWWRR